MASGSTGSNPFPKWQIAVALGATGVIGLGYWYLKQQSVQARRGTLANNINNVSIEDVQEAISAKETPLEKAQRFKNEGNQFFKKAKYEEAIAKYNKAIEECPKDKHTDLSTYYQNRAAAYEQLRKWSQVIDDCSKALELNSKYEKALYRRAKAYEIERNWESCLDDITAVCLLQGFQNQNAILMADRVLKELGKMHAAEAIKNKKPRLTSKQYIKTYFMSFSEDPVYNLLLNDEEGAGEVKTTKGFLKAKACFASEKYDDVIAACTEEVNSSESESGYIFEALSLRAAFHLLSGCKKEAFEDLNTIINSKDADGRIKVNALIKRAALYMQLGEADKCMDDFNNAADLEPKLSDVFHHRGQMYLLMEKTNEARQDFEKAVALNPDFAIAVVQKCYADYRYALMSNDVELLAQVLETFKNSTQKFSHCSEAFVLYGQVLVEKGDYEEADKLYMKALEIEPNNATILVHRGLLMLQWKGDIEKAVDLMKQAVRLDDKCEFAYETLGTVEVQRGNLIVAIDLFNKALDLAHTEMEMTHLFSLRDAAMSQFKVSNTLGIGPKLVKAGA